ncbi:putative cuticle protein [Operophtera brumata]|uniref:Putative cuticle protein n=1 Tax=Operophtera brumata TaxID=104452 RepID=A0A0L7L192_OPEBR|nr:putative cuticle protein [Operophtera brumata]
MGEFGFITADGVYHVTVYATDEQGRFKILSMKNIRVKPYPTYNKQPASARQGHSLDIQTPQQTLPQGDSLTQKPDIPFKKISIEKPARSCSSCSLPTTTTPAPAPAFAQPNVQNFAKNAITFNQNPASVNPQYPQNGAKTNSLPNQQNAFSNQNVGSTPRFSTNQQNNFNNPQTYSQEGLRTSQNTPAGNQNLGPQTPPELELLAPKLDSPAYPAINSPQAYPQIPIANSNPQKLAVSSYPSQNEAVQNYPSGPRSSYPADAVGQNRGTQGFGSDVQPDRNANTGGRTAKKYDGEPQQTFGSAGGQFNGIANDNAGISQGQTPPNKPTLISAQMQIVDKNTDIYQKGPGEKEGLPNGLTKNDMTQLLYTFNYTVGFHGHFEEGYINGAKQGYYYVTGRDGVRTRVDYVADDKGFRPKITQEVLDLLSEDVPKPETEKDEKYGLKGYEFKWLYFPVEPKGR